MKSIADIRVLAFIRVPRDPAILEASGIRPVVRILRLPRPLYPTARFLVRRNLFTQNQHHESTTNTRTKSFTGKLEGQLGLWIV